MTSVMRVDIKLKYFFFFQVDQLFSMLSNVLKSGDIPTLEVLKEKLVSAPIEPKPICKDLDFIYDWKGFILPKLTQPPLNNHSKYNSFLLYSEMRGSRKVVVFKAKRLPQHAQYVPRAGIRLIKEDTVFDPVPCAEYRIERINFDEIMKGIYIYLARQSAEVRRQVLSSWDRLRDKIERLPRKAEGILKMNISSLPKQRYEALPIPDYLIENDNDTELEGDLLPEEISEGDFDSEIAVDMDVVVYTMEKKGRPWVGRVIEILPEKKFIIHWFARKTIRSRRFEAMFSASGERNVSEMDNESVMIWQMSENRTESSFMLSNFWLEDIRREYETLDAD